jgi:phosphoglycerate dehydrogenase-like enzyme
MNTLRDGLRRAVVAVVALVAAATQAAAPATDVAATLERHGITPHASPSRAQPNWRATRKVLLLQVSQRSIDPATLRAAAPGAQLVVATDMATAVAEAVDADVIIGHNPEICDARIVDGARELRWLASLSAGVELCMPLPAVRDRRITLTNMRGVDSPVIAEHAIAMLLALAHGLDRFAVDTSRGIWNRGTAGAVRMQFLEGKTLLVCGLGGIGTEVARRAHGLGMRVVATRVGGGPHPSFVDYIGQPDELLTLARQADAIVSAVPLTPETTGLYDERFFSVLKPSALFINVARGPSVVTEALRRALEEGRLAGAGLDVTDPEPLPPGHPLWKAPRVLITPHISARSDLPGEARGIVAAENLRRWVAGEPLLNVVDLDRGF